MLALLHQINKGGAEYHVQRLFKWLITKQQQQKGALFNTGKFVAQPIIQKESS